MNTVKIQTPIINTNPNFDSLAAEEQLIILFDNYSANNEPKLLTYEELFKDIEAIKRTAIIINEMSDYYKEHTQDFTDSEVKSIMLTVGILDERVKASYEAIYEITEEYLNNPNVEEVFQISFNFKADNYAKEFKNGRYNMYITSSDLNMLKINETNIVDIKLVRNLGMAKWRKELIDLNK